MSCKFKPGDRVKLKPMEELIPIINKHFGIISSTTNSFVIQPNHDFVQWHIDRIETEFVVEQIIPQCTFEKGHYHLYLLENGKRDRSCYVHLDDFFNLVNENEKYNVNDNIPTLFGDMIFKERIRVRENDWIYTR